MLLRASRAAVAGRVPLAALLANFLIVSILPSQVDGNDLKRILNGLSDYDKEEIPTQEKGMLFFKADKASP
uniref:SERPIN domain-containing protein n=1 Tax=Panagrellus redivivus TaxID=6233 RepID=A0A7E4ZWL4_PANRE